MKTYGLSVRVFFFQAEDGIRDSETRLEFRRVLFRSRIADHFDVDVEIFRDSKRGAAINAELDGIAALRDLKIKNLVLRANGLSPKSLDLAADLIEHLRELEGLPEPGGNEGPGEKQRFG